MILKKLTAGLISLGMLFSFVVSPVPSYAAELGDVNGNGIVDTYDALLILQYTVKSAALSDEQLKTADMNNDGDVNSDDALSVLVKIVSGGSESNIDYSRYIGNYTGLFGEEKSPTYTAYAIKNGVIDETKSMTVDSFTVSITGFDGNIPQGTVFLSVEGMTREMPFSEMDSVEVSGNTVKLYHKGSSASIKMEIYLSEDNMTGKIITATILATAYDFPCTVYFEKN